MAIRELFAKMLGRVKRANRPEDIMADLVCRIIEKKVEDLREKGESGPIARMRYAALKEFCKDKSGMKDFLFIHGFFIVYREDVEELKKIEDDKERANIRGKMRMWQRSLSKTTDSFFKFIDDKAVDLSGRCSVDEDEPYGLRFLALQEIIEERECVKRNIKKIDWARSRFANCVVACIEDVECRIEVDKLIREEFKKNGDSYNKSSSQGWSSHVYDRSPNIFLLGNALNSAFKKKRGALAASGDNKALQRFGTQKAYHVDIERLIYNYKLKQNFTIIYRPFGETVSHALKVLMIEDDVVLAQDLCTGEDKFTIRRHRIADLIREGQDVTVIMDSDEMTEEELSTIVLKDGPLFKGREVERFVDLNYCSSGKAYFRLSVDKLKDAEWVENILHALLKEVWNTACILEDFRNGAYHAYRPIYAFIDGYARKDVKILAELSEFNEIIVEAAPEFKEKYFREEKELTDEERKAVKVVIYESAK